MYDLATSTQRAHGAAGPNFERRSDRPLDGRSSASFAQARLPTGRMRSPSPYGRRWWQCPAARTTPQPSRWTAASSLGATACLESWATATRTPCSRRGWWRGWRSTWSCASARAGGTPRRLRRPGRLLMRARASPAGRTLSLRGGHTHGCPAAPGSARMCRGHQLLACSIASRHPDVSMRSKFKCCTATHHAPRMATLGCRLNPIPSLLRVPHSSPAGTAP